MLVKSSGSGEKPNRGELTGIRFKATVLGTPSGDIVIDDIFDSKEPYYTRAGSGGLIEGVERVLPEMVVGDRWVLTVPSDLAFGTKGRKASAGKPRIPPGATVEFEVEVVALPGRETELIDIVSASELRVR